jgi:hypothetical protein
MWTGDLTAFIAAFIEDPDPVAQLEKWDGTPQSGELPPSVITAIKATPGGARILSWNWARIVALHIAYGLGLPPGLTGLDIQPMSSSLLGRSALMIHMRAGATAQRVAWVMNSSDWGLRWMDEKDAMTLSLAEALDQVSGPFLYQVALCWAESVNQGPAPVPGLGDRIVMSLRDVFPGLASSTDCPVPTCDGRGHVCTMIQHLNDDHLWTRERVADWLDRLQAEGFDLAHHPEGRPE